MSSAIDQYLADMQAAGRINSPSSERAYRGSLHCHVDDVANRDPRYTSRDDVKRTLSRWQHPNSQRTRRAHLVAFYDWLMEEGYRKDNPARQTRKPRKRPAEVYRLTRGETIALLNAPETPRERLAIFLGVCAGLRNAELRGLQGRHLRREGFISVSGDIAKGRRPRVIPVVSDLLPIVDALRSTLDDDDYVLPAQRFRDPGLNRVKQDKRKHPSSSQALRQLVKSVAKRAGIAAPISPHTMRHAYADHIAKHAGVQTAQALLGHADLGTTQAYLGAPTADELQAAVSGISFGTLAERAFYPIREAAAKLVEAPTRIELV